MIARHVRVTGRVQGVFYRLWTQAQALDLGVAGWVRNCRDGSVEAHVEGDAAALDQLIGQLRRGPPGAIVQGLIAEDCDRVGFDRFEVRD